MPLRPVITRLPVDLVARYRAVDRDVVGSAIVDTPSHLAALTEDIRARGIVVPLRLGFNDEFGILDGNHRIAVALRLGLSDVPVALIREPTDPQTGSRADDGAEGSCDHRKSAGAGRRRAPSGTRSPFELRPVRNPPNIFLGSYR